MSIKVFLLPHQDDEVFVQPFAKDFEQDGSMLIFLFLTKSESLGVRRNSESEAMLNKWFKNPQVIFLGDQLNIIDSSLYENLEICLLAIDQFLKSKQFTQMVSFYSPAYEGGHPDHDASWLLSAALTKRIKSLAFQFPLYHGKNTWGRFFRVADAISENGNVSFRHLTYAEIWQVLIGCWGYPSQYKTWLGLFPFLVFQLMTKKAMCLQLTDVNRVSERPHPGSLLYERYGRLSYDEFSTKIRDFKLKYLVEC